MFDNVVGVNRIISKNERIAGDHAKEVLWGIE